MNPRILIVDDDELVRKAVVRMVRAYLPDAVIETADNVANGKICLAVSGAHYDAMITDYDMPDGKGIELAWAAKGISPKTWVCLMSGGAPDLIGADSIYVDFFVAKPLPVAVLRKMLGQKIYDERQKELEEVLQNGKKTN